MTEQPMLLQVGYKVAYRQEMTWVVATIAAMEGDLPVEPNRRVSMALTDLFPPF
jgi:hypothetical protein